MLSKGTKNNKESKKIKNDQGIFLGTTFIGRNIGGNVVFDMFHKDKQRKYCNRILTGTMGAGRNFIAKK